MKPLSPKQVLKVKKKRIPDFVYEAFNELLIEHFRSGAAIISQEEAILRIMHTFPGTEITRTEILDNGWLDIESEYRENGWEVTYDSEYKQFVFEAIK
jgi:hypothetical protein